MKYPLGQALPELYEEQLKQKIAATKVEFDTHFDCQQLDVFPSPSMHFRMRAEFRIWHSDDQAHYAMYEPGEYKKPRIIHEYTIGSRLICESMPVLLDRINANDALKKRLFQVEFLSTLSNQLLVTLIYHKQLDDQWERMAQQLASDLKIDVVGRSRKQKLIIGNDHVFETLNLNVGEVKYQQIETGFTQPNAIVSQHMLNWSVTNSKNFGGDLLELYCGNGNFTIPLSHNFDKVLATEISKLSTRAALTNLTLNQRNNIELVRLSAEEASEALSLKRKFRRLAHLDLSTYTFSTVFVDPPRAGVDEQTLEFIRGFANIIYISCNPETLLSNIEVLKDTHQITKLALFDQFPYTDHRECGVILRTKDSAC